MKVSIIAAGRRPVLRAPREESLAALGDHVYERNRPDDTFGFGVVFSDQTLDTFKACDLVTYERIRRRFAYWATSTWSTRGR